MLLVLESIQLSINPKLKVRQRYEKVFCDGTWVECGFCNDSCKSSESAYKKAYEKAKQQQVVATEQERLRHRRPLRWK